ncbi:HAMP domain-containing sensor histidine kinase [Uliginosibacterium sp. H1]|uniref:HAMP domain-containing sensor histidine kinase n=1 Tax=Uliginosibacterium sp. H1 TaxID=3114757 RepID=UPI002E176BC0|nr:ATP-binding protein [Uliginosibacterium sp. H1]
MRVRYPGSFLKLLLLGFTLVIAPMAVAVVDAWFSLDGLSRRTETAITRAVQTTRDSRALGAQLITLERAARQQLVLRDPDALKAYETRRGQFLEVVDRLDRETPDPAIREGLESLRHREERIFALLQMAGPSPANALEAADGVAGDFVAMLGIGDEVLRKVDARIEADSADLRQRAEAARHGLLNRLLALIPVGLVIIVAMTVLIRRPIRRLGEAIDRLGEGRLSEPVDVRGPADLQALGRRLDWLRVRLEEVDTQKTRFLQHVSHELKTPLTAIHEGSQLLSDAVAGPLNEGQREIVYILRENVTKLRKHIENLLDYSGLRFGSSTLHRSAVPLATLFAQVAEDQKLALTARRVQLKAGGEGLTVSADRDKLRVVLDNLVSNAVKYAPEDSVIDLSAHLVGRGSDTRAIIEVSDEGPGLPETEGEIEQLFEPFVQGPAPQGVGIKGTGLGLSIVRELVGAHGGDVALLRNRPRGTRVRVSLPQATG